jgi:hypothetical protein
MKKPIIYKTKTVRKALSTRYSPVTHDNPLRKGDRVCNEIGDVGQCGTTGDRHVWVEWVSGTRQNVYNRYSGLYRGSLPPMPDYQQIYRY